MDQLLVPVDFSDYSRHALEVAVYIASKTKSPVKLLHVVEAAYTPTVGVTGDIVFDDDLYQEYVKRMMEKAEKILKAYVETLKSKGVIASWEVLAGRAYSVIADQFKQEGRGLIILGNKGVTDDDSFWIGSTADKVIRRAKVPVLTVKGKKGKFQIKNIVFASDFSEEASPVAKRVHQLALLFDAKIHLLMVNTPDHYLPERRSEKILKQFAEANQLTQYSVNTHYDETEEEGIVHFANQIRADIIAMGTHGRRGLAHLIKGSIAEDVVLHSSIPVLTFNIKSENKLLKSSGESAKRESGTLKKKESRKN
ncbi:MAG TPA: universal stress protein [Cytophagaceae bacterium]